jgi:phosphoenolpyruvate-protein kinase (PTS system EI component)
MGVIMLKEAARANASADEITLIAALSAPLDQGALSSGIGGKRLLLDPSFLHAEALMHAEERLYSQFASAVKAALGQQVILSAPVPNEKNAASGIRATLQRPALMEAYLSAALRASRLGPVALLLPLVCSTAEIASARQYTETTMRRLKAQGETFDELTELYISISSPAAVMHSRRLVQEADLVILELDALISLTLGASPNARDRAALLAAGRDPLLHLVEIAVGNTHLAGRRAAIRAGSLALQQLLPELIAMGIDALILSPSDLFSAAAVRRTTP